MKQLLVILIGLFSVQSVVAQQTNYNKVFFANSAMKANHFYSSVSYKGPSWVKNTGKKLPIQEEHFFTPGNSLELKYVSAPEGTWQARLLYSPIRGVDAFKPSTHLVFRLYVQSQTTAGELPALAVGKKDGDPSKFLSLEKFIENYETNRWLTVEIPRQELLHGGLDKLNQAAVVAFRQDSRDGKEHRLFIDQVELQGDAEKKRIEDKPEIRSARGFEKHVDLDWSDINDPRVKYVKIYRSTDNEHFQPVAIQSPRISRYADYTDTTAQTYYYKISLLDGDYRESPLSESIRAQTRPMEEKALLNMIQRAHFRYYWEGAEPNSGLALECIPGRPHMVATGASGFGMMALLAGAERDFISREQLVERFDKITRFLMDAEKFHGAFPHFIDGRTGEVVPFFGERDNGGDLVETAFLTQGLLAARAYFDRDSEKERKIRRRITSIWEGIEWDWYRKTDTSKFLYWHWSPDQDWVINHKLIGWNETMITYVLGISSPTHNIPAGMYYSGWAGQSKAARNYRMNWGNTRAGAHYTNGNTYYGVPLDVGVANGGPLFFTHYSFMGLNPHRMKDAYTNYFENNRKIARINHRYCMENPNDHKGYGDNCWGLTASDGPWDYSADEPRKERDPGKITPTGALASFPYTPGPSMKALKNYYRNYGEFLWGAYGFRDAFNLEKNWRSSIYMGLNQAPIVAMIENYRSKRIWELFMSNDEIKSGLQKIKKTDTPSGNH
mgnify:CR=1 FL=1